jgi:hypothetical protein
MKREPQSLTVHLRHAAHRIHRAAWMIDSGATALHCGSVLALTRGNTGKIRKLFFLDSMALEDKATVLRRNLSATDRQQAIRTEKFGAEIEKLVEMARGLRVKLENCYVKIKRYAVSVAAEEKKNPEFRKRTRQPRKVVPRHNSIRPENITILFVAVQRCALSRSGVALRAAELSFRHSPASP